MPDLITHTAFSYAISRSPRFDRFRIIFYLGTILPDVLTRPLYILNPFLYPYTVAIHTPLFMLLFCFFAAEFIATSIRKSVRRYLLAGVLVHFILDFFQRHIETGYLWLFPFSWQSFEIGLFWPETPLMLTPLWLALIAIVEIIRWRRKKQSPR